MPEKVLICGATGFIGRHVVNKALDEEWEVVVGTRSVDKARSLLGEEVSEIREMDVTEDKIFDLSDIDTVFNLAAKVPRENAKEQDFLKINSFGAYNLLRSCEEHDVSKYIQSSSMAVFGEPSSLPVDEEYDKEPQTPYGISKSAAEDFCRMKEWNNVQRIILRYSSVYGEGMMGGVTRVFLHRMIDGEPIEIHEDNSGDFVYVKDIARANIMAAKSSLESNFEDFNIGSGEEKTIEEIAKIIKDVTSFSGEIDYLEGQNKSRFCFDIEKAKKKLGYEPKYSYKEGIRDFYGDFRDE